MTRKDYKIIASAIKECVDKQAWCFDNEEDCLDIAKVFADKLQSDNPRFLYSRFYDACGVNKDAVRESEE